MIYLYINIIYLMLVLHLSHSARINGYERLIVLIFIRGIPVQTKLGRFFGMNWEVSEEPYLSVRGHKTRLGTLIERTSTAFSGPKGDPI